MVFTLWTIFKAFVLCINAVCILHEQRFLKKIGWSHDTLRYKKELYGKEAMLLFDLMHSIRLVARVPLIPMNIVIITFELLFG